MNVKHAVAKFALRVLKGVLPAPSNLLVRVINDCLDFLIKGLGEDFIYAYIVVQWPPAAWPILSTIIKQVIAAAGLYVDTNTEKIADTLVIRLANDIKTIEYNNAIAQITKPGATDAEIQAGFNAIDNLISAASS